MADNKYVQELKELQKNKAVQTLMYVVPWAEGSVDRNTPRERAYYRLFGFNKDGSGRFADNLDIFPDSPGYYRDPKTGQVKASSDAGLYQLLARYILGDAAAYELTQVTSSRSQLTSSMLNAHR